MTREAQRESAFAGGRPAARRTAVTLVVKAYLVAGLFTALFAGLLAYGSKVNRSLSEPTWAVVVAAVLTLPAFAPWIARELLPRMRSIRISELEIVLTESGPGAAQAIAQAVQTLSANLADSPVLNEYAGRMTSLSGSIIDAIKAVQAADHEVLPVDLQTTWVVPNLYFLALMAAQKTRVRQIVFVDSRVVPDDFICTSSPDEVLTALEWRHAELREAAGKAQFNQDPRTADSKAGQEFFSQLGAIYAAMPGANTERVPRLTPETLLWILGPAAHRSAVQWADPPGERVYRQILASDSPFVAALQGTSLLFLVSRERVATAVARAAVRQV